MTPLPSIPFDQPGDYEFHFRQTHRREMTLMLRVEPWELWTQLSQRPALTNLQTKIEVFLTDHAGRAVCRASGQPHDGITQDEWVLTNNPPAFWHEKCSEITLKRGHVYTLSIHIRDVDPRTPKIRLTPTFQRSDDFSL